MKKIKQRAKELKAEITALYYAYKDPNTSLFPKILIFITLGYALSPIDLIPDFIPLLGYLDDLIILPGLIMLSIKLIPRAVMTKARLRATEEPLSLKKNWFVGVIFISLWILLLIVIVKFITKN